MTKMREYRNIAIIAHVDHGKTTLVDQLLKYSGTFKEHEQIESRVCSMTSNENGALRFGENTAVKYKMSINILDTPGHADFGAKWNGS